ncbi:PPR repeat protein [Medicago truncatula]|uniref:PPR repeat protein n=1 Tax=Medicago truncatula TaxID=3880 RepID=A0A072VIG8_MEDTR|nr:PPR repeat protein [Medicago truncatula]
MDELGFCIGLSSFSALLHVAQSVIDLKLYGRDCLSYGMVRRGFSENSFVYTSFIRAFCEKGRIEEAIGLTREMEGKGLRVYGETYECVII